MCAMCATRQCVFGAGARWWMVLTLSLLELHAENVPARPAWNSPNRWRLWLQVEPGGRLRSNSPASVEVDFQQLLREQGVAGTFDEFTLEVQCPALSLSKKAVRVPH